MTIPAAGWDERGSVTSRTISGKQSVLQLLSNTTVLKSSQFNSSIGIEWELISVQPFHLSTGYFNYDT